MYEIKNGSTAYLPVRFFDQNGLPLSGVSYTSVSATLLRADNTSIIVSPASSSDFFEITFGDFAGSGVYFLRVLGASFGVNGIVSYAVSTSVVGAKKHVGVLNIVAQVENDTYSRLGAPAGASVSADIAAIKTDSSSVLTKIGTPAGASVSADIAAVKTVADSTSSTASTINTKVGTPTGASVSADIAAVKGVADSTSSTASSVNTKLGTPAGASVSADIAAIKTDTTKIGTPTGASVSADLSALSTSVASVKTDTTTTVTRIGVPAGASLASDVAAVKGVVDILQKIETGRWKYFKTGPNANKMIIYEPDGTTPLYTFNMLDETGTGTSINPYERVPA
jgi:hypothetical protein